MEMKAKWSEFVEQIVEQMIVSEERNKSQRAGLWESQLKIQVGKLTIWVWSYKIEKL